MKKVLLLLGMALLLCSCGKSQVSESKKNVIWNIDYQSGNLVIEEDNGETKISVDKYNIVYERFVDWEKLNYLYRYGDYYILILYVQDFVYYRVYKL